MEFGEWIKKGKSVLYKENCTWRGLENLFDALTDEKT